MRPGLAVLSGGLATSVQDLGRVGLQSLGVPVAGALDPFGLRLANALAAMPEDAGALEIRLFGPTLRVEAESVRVALAGAETALEVLGPAPARIPAGRSATLARGTVFRVGAVADAACCYLAVAGGFDLAPLWGSVSTYAPAALGGLEGRVLRDGDRLPLAAERAALGGERAAPRFDHGDPGRCRVVLGPQADYFTDAGLATFLSSAYTVSREANRMGARLDGPALAHAAGYNIPSDGIVSGAIQVPGDGKPIILLADRQTTGGYPKIATVISADLPKIGRALPGARLRFEAVDVAAAEAARRAKEAAFRALLARIAPLGPEAAALRARLMTENLISGAVAGGGEEAG